MQIKACDVKTAPAGPFRRTHPVSRCRLENKLAAQLKLPRRPAISRRETRRRNLAERRRLYVARRLPEVRMVQDVERIHPQLEQQSLKYVRVLLRGKIEVREPGANACIALNIPNACVNNGLSNTIDRRRLRPLNLQAATRRHSQRRPDRADVGSRKVRQIRDRTLRLRVNDRANLIRTHNPGQSVVARTGCGNVHRIARLVLHDRRNLEARYQSVALPRKGINRGPGIVVSSIEVREPIVPRWIIAVLE